MTINEISKIKYNITRKKWRIKNKERFLASHRKYQNKIRKERLLFINNYKSKHPCIICSETRIECLTFHHLYNKKNTICDLHRKTCSLNTLTTEIDKCVILCSNCHRKKHAVGSQKSSPKKKYLKTIKEQSKCYFCDENTPCCLDFHHINPKIKLACITEMIKFKIYSLYDLQLEIEKCIIICSNCHRLLHANKLSLPEDIQPIKLDIRECDTA